MSPEREIVELHCAYEWTCPDCGTNHFASAVVVEFGEEDTEWILERYGGDPSDWETGKLLSRPDQVTCPDCGAEWPTSDDLPPTDDEGDFPP